MPYQQGYAGMPNGPYGQIPQGQMYQGQYQHEVPPPVQSQNAQQYPPQHYRQAPIQYQTPTYASQPQHYYQPDPHFPQQPTLQHQERYRPAPQYQQSAPQSYSQPVPQPSHTPYSVQVNAPAPQRQTPTPSRVPSQQNHRLSQQRPYNTVNHVEHRPVPVQRSRAPDMTPRRQERQSQPNGTPATAQWVVSHVQIPVQMSTPQQGFQETRQQQPSRSYNAAQALSRCDGPTPAPSQRAQQHLDQASASSPLIELACSQVPTIPERSDVDYQSVLLGLADEYIAAAHSMSGVLVRHDNNEDMDHYCLLLSTGMGCIQSILDNWRQQDPRKEARLRLRLASLLYEETENEMEAEEVLSKGITLCDRSRLHDLKYSMHHLLARVLAKNNPRAAVTAVDKLIPEIEAFQHTQWAYTFHFLRTSLSLQLTTHSETATVLKHLSSIKELAENNRHVAILVAAAALETVVHLRSAAPDAVELAQRALASARTHQLEPDMQRLPQLLALLDCLDLACSLQSFNPDQAAVKMQAMQSDMDKAARQSGWNSDGTFLIPMDTSKGNAVEADTAGIMKRMPDGRDALVFKWLSRTDLYSLGYLLSGISSMYKNSTDSKSEKYLLEGVKTTTVDTDRVSASLSAATLHSAWRGSMGIMMHLHLVLAYCNKSDWLNANGIIAAIHKELAQDPTGVDMQIKCMVLYLDGMCKQGLGESEEALALFRSPELVLPKTFNKRSGGIQDLRTLAALNSILILRTMLPGQKADADTLLNAVEPYCLSHPSKTLLPAYYIIKATGSTPSTAIIKTKQHLQQALGAAKAVANSQLLSIIMNVMTSMFFTNIVGDQAEKSARAGRTLAKKTQDKLWTAVADGMLSATLEQCGKNQEADGYRREGEGLMQALPESLKKSLEEMELD